MVISLLTIALAAAVSSKPGSRPVSHNTFDTSGRLTSSEFGTSGAFALTGGTQPAAIADSFSKFMAPSFQGALPTKVQSTERQGVGPLDHTFQYNPTGAVTLSHYDAAGRLTVHTTKDARVEWLTFDNDGHPLTTRQTRYRGSTGLDLSPVFLDRFDQTHTWNAFGERTSWTMPRPSTPITAGWTDTVTQDYDAAGNLTQISRTQSAGTASGTLMTASFRNAGRPTTRSVTTSCTGLPQPCTPAAIVRNYAYDATSGQLNEMQVVANGTTVAGTHVHYQNTLQAHDLQLLGVSSGTRWNHIGYDDRGRLTGSVFGTTNPTPNPAGAQPGATAVALTPADFLSAQLRTPLLDDTTCALAAAHGVSTATIEPPSSSIVELPLAAHKTSTVTESGVTRSILYDNNGGQVSDDGRFVYGWDAKGMLESVTEKPISSQVPIRRVLYYYDGNHRMVGRRSETATPVTLSAPLSTLDWQLETRANILSADGLPAEVTFVWDPVSDNMVSVVQAGGAPSDPNAGVLKQIIHGGLGYDDPIEVTSATAGSTPRRLYPTYDEAGAGTLQTVMTASGQLVARNVPTDGYGAHHLELTGAAVDAVFLEAGRDSQGVLTVDVTLRSTEQIAASSVATGIRLSTVDSKGAVVRTSTTVPRLDPLDPFAARITLTADDWTTLTDPAATSPGGLTAQALSIAVTSTLRAAGWPNDLQYLPPPDWALATAPVYGTDSLRVEVRESLPSLADWIAAIAPSGTNRRSLYQVDLLALLAKPSAGGDTPITTLLTARFQAQPFADPFTGKNYVRERWYDPERGSWLSPDPVGYRDSANLYAYAGGDPVNARDATGLCFGSDETCADIGSALWGMVSSKKELKKTLKRTGASVGGAIVGAAKTIASANPVSMAIAVAKQSAGSIGGAIGAYQAGGATELKNFIKDEGDRQNEAALDSLPVIGTGRSFKRSVAAYEHGDNFAGGMGIGETTVRAEGDVLLAAGVHELVDPGQILTLELPRPPLAPVVIGEGMTERAIPFAEANGYQWYKGSPELPESEWLGHNQEWIRNRVAEGRTMIDVGPHPGRANYPLPTSDSYAMELKEMVGYPGYKAQPLSEPERLQITSGNYH
jgi:RHS repeat-associated protein